MNTTTSNAFRELMEIRGLGMPNGDELTIEGSDPIFPSPFKFGETTASALAARAIAANNLWELKTGRRQQIRLDVEADAKLCIRRGYSQEDAGKPGWASIVISEKNL